MALAESLSNDALLASNTSSLSIDELADVTPHPGRVLGLHFFNPAPRMELVEIVRGDQTSDEAAQRAAAIVARFGKTAVFAADTPGFIVNRVARPYYLQALRALERGVASAAELDALARGAGFRMGPFELMDLIGLDVNLATSESVYRANRSKTFGTGRAAARDGRAGFARTKERRGLLSIQRRPRAALRTQGRRRRRRRRRRIDYDRRFRRRGRRTRRSARLRPTRRLRESRTMSSSISSHPMRPSSSTSATALPIAARCSRRSMPRSARTRVIFADAYATDLAACAAHLRHPEPSRRLRHSRIARRTASRRNCRR